MPKIRFIILLFLIIFTNFVLAAESDSDSDNQDALTSRKLTFKVYRLKVHDISVGNFKSDDGSEYNSYPCQINRGCRWYSRPRSLTAPHYWQLVQEGTGCVIEQDRIDRNKGEHWLYFLPSEITGLRISFAIVFGNGEFFKVSHYPGTEGGKGFFGINEDLGYGNFGSKVVRNIVGNPIVLAKTKGTIGGKPCYPYSKLFTYVKGIDFCSVEKRVTSVRQFLDVCSNLETLYWQGEFELHSYFEEHIRTANLRRIDVSDKVNHENPEEELEEAGDDSLKARDLLAAEESKRLVTFKEGDRQLTAYRVFDKYYTFEGLDQFLEETRTEVQKLCGHELLKLPAFNKHELRKYLPSEPQGQEENGNKKERIDWEGIYNARTALSTGYILLDKRLVRNVEVCDLLTAHKDHRFLIHVKIGTDSSNLNHLFGQGYASACLMSQGEYPEEVFIKLVRERLSERASTILTDEFTNVRLDLWNEFKAWREAHQNRKGILDDVAESTVVEEILGKINKTSKTMSEAIESLESLKAHAKTGMRSILEQVVKTLKIALDSGDSSLSQVEKILRDKFSPKVGRREKLIWESDDFPDKKEEFAEFCKALKDKRLQTKEDNSAKEIASRLEKYRKDLLDDHIKTSFDRIADSLKIRKNEKDLRAFFKPKLRISLDGEHNLNKRIRLVLSALKEEYLKKKTKQLSDEQFESVIGDKESLNYFRQLYDYVLIPQKGLSDGQVLKVVFAIITDKTVEDPEFMPLGARINFIRTAKDIEKLNASGKGISFSPVVVAIMDTSSPPKGRNASQSSKKKKDKEMIEPDDLNESESGVRGGEPTTFQDTQILEEASQLAEIRSPLQELVMANKEIQDMVRRKMLDLYIQLYYTRQSQSIPKIIFAKIDANQKYEKMREIVTSMTEGQINEMPELQSTPFKTIRDNANPPFADQELLDCIKEEDISQYLSSPECDVDIPVERNQHEGGTAIEKDKGSQKNPSRKRGAKKIQEKLPITKKKPDETRITQRNPMDVDDRAIVPSFRDPIRTAKSIEPFAFFRVDYRLRKPDLPQLYDDYIVGPAIGDGDCFFHAVFTQDGQTAIQLIRQAETIRSSLKAVVISHEPYKDIIRWEVFGDYQLKFRNHQSIPDDIERMMRDNETYENKKTQEQTMLQDIESKREFQKPYTELATKMDRDKVMDSSFVTSKLKQALQPYPHHEDASIAKLISEEEIETYLERYIQNRGPQSYIEIPVGQGQKASIANIIAESQNILIHYFLFDEREFGLNYSGSIGNQSSTSIVSILYRPGHFWALFNPQMPENRRKGIIQTEINYNHPL